MNGLRGGQGRTDLDVEKSGLAIGTCLGMMAIVLGLILCFGGCGCTAARAATFFNPESAMGQIVEDK
jgi:hypothetical protein